VQPPILTTLTALTLRSPLKIIDATPRQIHLSHCASAMCLVLSSFERGITEFDSHGAHLLRWIYLRTLSLRRPLRVALGARLVKYGQSPDVLKVVNITPLLRVCIMKGMKLIYVAEILLSFSHMIDLFFHVCYYS
jgi:hypothetical protein